jgi:hypothetical protein
MTTTNERLRQWVDFWSAPGDPNDKGPRRPKDVDEYHDKQLKRAGRIVCEVKRERGR